MNSKEKYNDQWIGYFFIPFAAIFTYYIGEDTPFKDISFETIDFIYIVLNIITGLLIWSIIKNTMLRFIKEEITLSLFCKAFLLNLFVSLSFLIITRLLHDVFVVKIQTSIEFYSLDLPTDTLFILVINLIYLILFYKKKLDEKLNLNPVTLESFPKIMVQSSKKNYSLNPSEIAMIQLDHKITFLYTIQGEKIATAHSLRQIFQKLPESIFFLANRQFILHRDLIRSYALTDTRKLKIELVPALGFKKDIFISKAKSQAFKNWFLDNQDLNDRN